VLEELVEIEMFSVTARDVTSRRFGVGGAQLVDSEEDEASADARTGGLPGF
jgi:hypothetical protein